VVHPNEIAPCGQQLTADTFSFPAADAKTDEQLEKQNQTRNHKARSQQKKRTLRKQHGDLNDRNVATLLITVTPDTTKLEL
jgi:hypothetical protein